MGKIYDVIIIGGGPAGYTAALYSARAGLSTLVLEKLSAGGQMALTGQVDNYPGFEEGIDGFSLGEKMQAQAERFGAATELSEVTGTELSGEIKSVTAGKTTFLGKTVIAATGANPRKLGASGEDVFSGRGVHYCAACDGRFYKDKTAVIVGGGNSAASDAMLLSRICKEVILIHRRDALRASKIYHAPLLKVDNIKFCWNSIVTEILQEEKNAEGLPSKGNSAGDRESGVKLSGVRIRNVKTKEESEVPCGGVFVSIGRTPASELFRRELKLDASGYIQADESTRTNIPGVFAAGDVRTKALRQIVAAAADGAAAVHYAEEYLAQAFG